MMKATEERGISGGIFEKSTNLEASTNMVMPTWT